VAHDPDTSAAQRLQRLRHLRIPREREDSVAGVFKAEGTRLARLDRKVGGVAEAWESVCPAECAPRTRVVGIAKGVLTIGVADAATRWHLERLLRAGADRDIVSRCPMTVRRIRLIADAEAADPHHTDDSPAG
jgi:hypothetical protein